MAALVRPAAIQTKNRTISYKLPLEAALAAVEANLEILVGLVEAAADQDCDIVAFPEDTLGTLEWESGHWGQASLLLQPAERMMLERLGEVAGRRKVAVVCCNDCVEGDRIYNSAILIGTDGCELGRYRKVQPTLAESLRARGDTFPVFAVPGIGTVGLCICYDMVFPETTRALALAGADLVFHLTLGGASMAGPAASLAAFRTRAADNFVYIVVAFRGGGSMIIDPKGEIVAEGGNGADAIVAAQIDVAGGRDAGDALGGITDDFRARLFRERNPAAYRILTDAHPPVLDKLQGVEVPSIERAAQMCAEGMTVGADAFYEGDKWLEEGRLEAARQRFTELAARFGTIWIGRVAQQRLAEMGANGDTGNGTG